MMSFEAGWNHKWLVALFRVCVCVCVRFFLKFVCLFACFLFVLRWIWRHLSVEREREGKK